MLRPTPGDPGGVEQHHWNTGAKENQLTPQFEATMSLNLENKTIFSRANQTNLPGKMTFLTEPESYVC